MLNNEQLREYNRAARTNDFFDENTAVYAGYTPFKNEVGEFEDNFKSFTDLVPDKDIITKGITTGKTDMKRSISKRLADVCNKTHAYALKVKNNDLAAQTNFSETGIFKKSDADMPGFAQTINNLINPLLGDATYQTYGVTAAQMEAIVTDATTFNGMLGQAKVTGSGIGVANTDIDAVIELLRENYKQFDLLIGHFEDDNMDFVQGYEANSRIDNRNVRHTGIEGHVLDKNGVAVLNGLIKLMGTTKNAKTDLYGAYRLDHVPTDDYQVECSAPGFKTQVQVFHIARGRIDTLDWVLEGE